MLTIDLGEVFYSFSKALDLSLNGISYHHQTVALIALAIAENLEISETERQLLFYSALVHDAGMNPEYDLKSLLPSEDTNEFEHCQKGYEIFSYSTLTKEVATIILHHHDHWEVPGPFESKGDSIPLASNILYLADRVSVLCEAEKNYILNSHQDIIRKIIENSGKLFNPVVVNAFLKASEKEAFWLDLQQRFLPELINLRKPRQSMQVSPQELLSITRCLCQVIDNKSPYTNRHSQKVAAGAEYLAEKLGFSEHDLVLIKIAGYLHDLGKLAIPNYILDKPSTLSSQEFAIIKQHVYYSYNLLNNISGLEPVAAWAAFHHEKLDGTGYPFRLKAEQIPLGSRVMAVSDIFAALTEDRPYRLGLHKDRCLATLQDIGARNQIDNAVVSLVAENFDELLAVTRIQTS